MMKDEELAHIADECKDWEYMDKLYNEIQGFQLTKIQKIEEDRFDLFMYSNELLHKSVIAYYHAETHEYKLRVCIGFFEFCRIEFITSDRNRFQQILDHQLVSLISSLVAFDPKTVSSLIVNKGICTWEYARKLPEKLEGYQLFIRPEEPQRINNGSYIIIDYVDFSRESDVSIYYNMYRDEFFGEARIRRIPDVNYDFDSHSLSELQEKIEQYLVPRLREVRNRAERKKEIQNT
jgi:hypothetical protein